MSVNQVMVDPPMERRLLMADIATRFLKEMQEKLSPLEALSLIMILDKSLRTHFGVIGTQVLERDSQTGEA